MDLEIVNMLSGLNVSDFVSFFRSTYCPKHLLKYDDDGTIVLMPPTSNDHYFYLNNDPVQKTHWYVSSIREEDMDEHSMRFIEMGSGQWYQSPWYDF